MATEPRRQRGNGDEAPSLTSRVYARLRQDIMDGSLSPGARLKVEELRRQLGAGASPIREALSLLTSDHLVERLDQRGFRVAQVSKAEFQELLQTRCWLEERALRESIARGGTDWEEGVVLAHYHLTRAPRTAPKDGPPVDADWEDLHKQFHLALLAACGSSILLRICGQLYDQNTRYRQMSRRATSGKRNIGDEHAAIKDAVLDRDADLAVERLIAHYQRTGALLADQID